MLNSLSPAKINLFLEIISKRSDNFHNLNSVFQVVPLYDKLSLSPAETIELQTNNTIIPVKDNLIIKAAELLKTRYKIKEGGKFTLQKNIPSCAGLGGGSSNAATALVLANKLWKLNLKKEKLAAIGSEIGSDVPFFIYAHPEIIQISQNSQTKSENDSLSTQKNSHTCLCKGRGEIITPLENAIKIPVRIIAPNWGIPTPKAFSLIKAKDFNRHSADHFIRELTLANPDIEKLYKLSFNHFEEAVFSYEPRQRQLHEILLKNKMLPRMSGSGSAIFLFNNPQTAELENILPQGCRIIL